MGSNGKGLLTVIIVPIISIIGIFLFGNAQGLLITPNFDTDIFYPNDDFRTEVLTIKNNGWLQAKNVKVFINSQDQFDIVQNSSACFEGEYQLPNPDKTLRIEFDKLSTNVNCLLTFESSNDGKIFYIVITGDNTPGYQWFYKKGELKEFGPYEIFAAISSILLSISILATFYHQREKVKKVKELKREFESISKHLEAYEESRRKTSGRHQRFLKYERQYLAKLQEVAEKEEQIRRASEKYHRKTKAKHKKEKKTRIQGTMPKDWKPSDN